MTTAVGGATVGEKNAFKAGDGRRYRDFFNKVLLLREKGIFLTRNLMLKCRK